MLARYLLILYVILAPWASWLAITGWLRLPVMVLLACLVCLTIGLITSFIRCPLQIIKSKEDIWLLGLVCMSIIAFLINEQTNTSRSLNHVFSIAFFVFIYLILFKWAWLRLGLSVEDLFKYIALGLVLADGIIILEWVFVNVFSSTILRDTFILNYSVANMSYYQQPFFKSVPGMAEEPSLMTFNINCLFPLAYYYCKNYCRAAYMYGLIALQILALVATASAGGIGFFILGFLIGQISVIKPSRIFQFLYAGIIRLGVLVFVYFLLPELLKTKADFFLDKIKGKFVFEDASAGMRTRAWASGITDWLESPWFGRGPAFGHEAYQGFGYQSMYIKLLAETGIISIVFICIFFVLLWRKIMMLPVYLRPWIAMAIASGMMHLMISDAYYHASFWVAVAGLQLFFVDNKQTMLPQHGQ